jgi:RNA polymerase sigma-70 factor (ECF subfamily)
MDAKGKKAEILLARKAIKGDEQAFVTLYEQNIKVILYQVGKLLYVKDDAADVAQEVVMHMYRSIRGLKSPEAFRSWMYRIIETTCYRYNNVAGKHKDNEDIDDYKRSIADMDVTARPAEAAEVNETNRAVQAMIDELPEKQKMALFMYYYEDMSYRQIAKALDITVSTVSTNIMKAKATLKKRMEEGKILQKTRKLDSVGLIIASAFRADVAGSVTSVQVDAVAHVCGERIASLAATHAAAGNSAAATKAGVSGVKLSVVIPVAVSVSIGALIASSRIMTGDPFVPDAVIRFSGAGSPSQTNPNGAELITDEGTPVRWRIVDETGRALVSGEGMKIGENAFDLPAGEYTVEWIVTDGKDRSATVRREMTIE